MGDLRVLGLFGGQRGLPQQIERAQHARHRRAQFMAHMREEFGFQPRGLFGKVAGGGEVLGRGAFVRDVLHHPDRAARRIGGASSWST